MSTIANVPDSPEKQNIEAAFVMTREAARKYEFETRGVDQPMVLREQPIRRWSIHRANMNFRDAS